MNTFLNWLVQSTGGSDGREQQVADLIRELERTEKRLSEEQVLTAMQEALLAQRQLELEAAQAQVTRLLEGQTTDSLTGFPHWAAFLEQAELLFAGFDKPGAACAVCLELVRLEGLPNGVMQGNPEDYLRSCGKQLKRLPQSMFVREGQSRILGIVYGAVEADFTDRLQAILSCGQESAALFAPLGIRTHRVILGTAWYPADCDSIEDLLERAKLAAYTAGKNQKEGLCPYQSDTPDGYLLEGKQVFSELIEKKQVRFGLQPIVRSANAKVDSYALVMESRSPKLRQMDKVLAVADYLGRRQALEQLYMFDGMAYVAELVRQGKLMYNSRIWLRSFGDTCLTDQEDLAFQEANFDHLKHIVLDLEENGNDAGFYGAVKRQRARQWGAQTVLGCGGLEAKDEMALCLLQPELVRAKAELVRGLAKSKKKQAAFLALKEYADAHGWPLLADGIENAADLKMAVELGAAFLQGGYLGKPEAVPGELPEKRIEQIGQAQYGKRG